VRGGDCGELIASSFTLGIAHPSGYPIWCLTGKLFSLLPLGEVAWRYNLFSALCGALAAATIAATGHRLLQAPGSQPKATARRAQWSATGAGLLLSGFFFFGSQALLAEVYALAALEGAALLYFALKWKQDGDWRDFYTFAWLAGLSPLIHLSGIFLWPFLGVWAFWRQKGVSWARVAPALALWGSSWIFVLYFPLRSGHFPAPPNTSLDGYLYFPLDWGHPASLAAFKNHITAAQYNGLLQPRTLPDLLENAAHLGQFLWFQYLWATPLLLWGAIAAFKRNLGWILATIFVLNVGVEIQYDVSDQSNFFFPAYLVMALWMAVGWFEFLSWLQKRGDSLAKGNSTSMWPWRLRTLGTSLLIATVGAQWFLFAGPANQRSTFRPRDGALEAARAAQQLSQSSSRPVTALYVFDDTLWAFWYAKYVLGAAPNVETPWGRGLLRISERGKMVDYVAQLKKEGPVVLAQWDERTDARFPLVMLTPSGNLCLASDRALPPAAQPLKQKIGSPTPGANGLLQAKFRRAALWSSSGGKPAFSPSSLAAFEVDFRVSPQLRGALIEVLLAKSEALGKPAPNQQSVLTGSAQNGAFLVSRQKRRLVLPPDAKAGQVLRAAVPLQIESASPTGEYKVWTRLVTSPHDSKIAWTLTDEIRLTAK
jgi:hypothetical protein